MRQIRQQRRLARFALMLAVAVPALGWAQKYPSRPIRFIVGFAPGGVADLMARALAQHMTEAFSQQVIVDNRSGGGGTISMQLAAQAPPDAHTLIMGSSTQFSINPALRAALPYDPVRDFTPITHVALTPVIFTVQSAMPAKSIKDLVQLAKSRPGQRLSYGSPGYGGAPHVAGELFRRTAGLDLVHVPYKGGPPAATALLGGETDMSFGAVSTYLPHMKSGRLRALGVTSPKRLSAIPDVPTFIEAGFPGFEVVQWFGVFGPAKLTPAVTKQLNAVMTRALETSQLKNHFALQGVELIGSTPEELAAYVTAQLARWSKIVTELAITEQP
ncbi:MAG: tripartite tricarboxylate transporter substrate binding protein [Burkholderiales bacterium]|nr:tripartite tricarboxylate transporter substrate binding protein [Burkholderiales bacterium]